MAKKSSRITKRKMKNDWKKCKRGVRTELRGMGKTTIGMVFGSSKKKRRARRRRK